MDPVSIIAIVGAGLAAVPATYQILQMIADLYERFRSHSPGRNPAIEEIEIEPIRDRERKKAREKLESAREETRKAKLAEEKAEKAARMADEELKRVKAEKVELAKMGQMEAKEAARKVNKEEKKAKAAGEEVMQAMNAKLAQEGAKRPVRGSEETKKVKDEEAEKVKTAQKQGKEAVKKSDQKEKKAKASQEETAEAKNGKLEQVGAKRPVRANEIQHKVKDEDAEKAKTPQKEGKEAHKKAIESETKAKAPEQQAMKVKEGAQRPVGTANEQLEKVKAEEAEQARTEQKEAKEAVRKAMEKEKKAKAAEEEATRRWKSGIHPVAWPTWEELKAIKEKRKYTEGFYHLAITGVAGSGKSSLVNAVRGLRNNDPGAAATGVVETTHSINRYPDPEQEMKTVWYDIPGAGTPTIPNQQYFNKQGLYIFDAIIVVINDRFLAIDVEILKSCRCFKIPAYIIRSKADQHIRNVMNDEGYNSPAKALKKFVEETRQTVADNLENAKLSRRQKVYIVSNETLRQIVNGTRLNNVVNDTKLKYVIDEHEFVRDLLSHALARRARTR